MDAEIGIKAVEHLLATFTAASLRLAHAMRRCNECGSYEVVAGVCRHCDWTDPSYAPPAPREWSEEERTKRLAKPCTLTSDISTFITPNDLIHTKSD